MKVKSDKQIAKALYEATLDANQNELKIIINNFVAFLFKNRRLRKINKIIHEFEAYCEKKSGIEKIVLQLANKHSEVVINKIAKLFGKKISASVEFRPELIGGFLVKTDEIIFDASVKRQLISLNKKLL